MPELEVSRVLDAPVEEVWERIRDFGSLGEFHPAVTDCTLDGGQGDQIGVVRQFRLGENTLREQLVEMSDRSHYRKYSMLEAPLPVSNYVGELRLFPITAAGGTLARWSARFDVPPDAERETMQAVTEVFESGLENLATRVGS